MKRLLTVFCLLFALLALPAVASAAIFPPPYCSTLTDNSMPQTTQRQLIVDEFIRRLGAIDSTADPLANGYQYQTDIGKNLIERWRTNFNQDELKNAVSKAIPSVFDLVRTRAKDFPDQVSVVATLPVQVRVFHYRDAVTADELTKMLADVQQAVVTNPDTGKRDLTLGGLAIDIKPGDDGFIIPTETFTLEGGAVGFEIEHDLEPYGQ